MRHAVKVVTGSVSFGTRYQTCCQRSIRVSERWNALSDMLSMQKQGQRALECAIRHAVNAVTGSVSFGTRYQKCCQFRIRVSELFNAVSDMLSMQ